MTQQPHTTPPSTPPVWDQGHQQAEPAPPPDRAGSGWATGGLVFAGVLMLVNGVLAILQGISALAADDVYDRIGDYVYKISLTGWGWIMLVLGAVLVGVGYGVLKGAWWARMTGIFLASAAMVLHFLFLPYSPVWSGLMIGVDFFVIWALATAPDSTGARRGMT
ncbi:DUF7144 family membrane protein [Streptomyces justiciae]|uniref:DUF7144 family membrane protein n=1 Tax=Streptomyces justiciae TaxID=2780140 RepID=UPI0018811B16|nr:hypothetical protein [Streptomyces justiciae]MBE8471321.1 hypothetical protein [Streptomyces justiciae]MCW8377103.1 hypothetical protein [Streptomyces justiciae]